MREQSLILLVQFAPREILGQHVLGVGIHAEIVHGVAHGKEGKGEYHHQDHSAGFADKADPFEQQRGGELLEHLMETPS